MSKVRNYLSGLLLSVALASCTTDAYDKGEGKYSLMRGEFVEAYADEYKHIPYITTDDGELLPLLQDFTANWVTTADSTYRCRVYYNKVTQLDGSTKADIISMGLLPTFKLLPAEKFEDGVKTDPVHFESIWKSKTGKYINLSLRLMTGVADDDEAVQSLGMVDDGTVTRTDGKRVRCLRLYHDQGNVPEYYTTKAYSCFALEDIDADSVQVTLNTYKGTIVRCIAR